MVECDFCGREMKTAEGCIPHELEYVDGDYEDAPKHTLDGSLGDEPPEERCHDCGAEPGGVHHPGCDWAREPRGGRQLLGHPDVVASVVFEYGEVDDA